MLPAAVRGAPSSSATKFSSVRRPSATSSIVPTRIRFMLRMNESASMWNVEHVALAAPAARRDVARRSAGGRSPSGVKAVKSCVPWSAAAQASSASSSTAVRPPQRAAALERPTACGGPARGRRSGGCGRRGGRRSRRRHLLGAQDDDLARQHRVDRAQVRQRAVVGDDLAERVDAAVGAPGDGRSTGWRRTISSALTTSAATVRRPGCCAQPAKGPPSYSKSLVSFG